MSGSGSSKSRPSPLGVDPTGVNLNVMEPISAENSPARPKLFKSPTARLERLISTEWNYEKLDLPQDIKDILRVFDSDGDGSINVSEVKEAGDMIFAAKNASTTGSVSLDAMPKEMRGMGEEWRGAGAGRRGSGEKPTVVK